MSPPPAPAGLVLEADGLARRYGVQVAVDSFGLHVGAGEVVVLLGPNGCGKTTGVEMCLGLRRRDRGDVSICGLDPMHDRRRLARLVGVQLQGAQLHPQATVRDAFRYLAALHAGRGDVWALLDQLGLSTTSGTRYGRLSGGQQRRVMVAVALCGNPKLAVLDEPTSGVDPESRALFWSCVRAASARGVGILTTTHDLGEAGRHADRVVIMRRGRTAAEGTPDELVAALPFDDVFVVRTSEGTTPPGLVLASVPDEVTVGVVASAADEVAWAIDRSTTMRVIDRRSPGFADAYLYAAISEGPA